MTVAERARALEAVGFTPRQAQFLGLAALVSGYCLRRHYQAFAQVSAGVQVRRLLDDLVAHRWAARLRFRADRAHVYHLSAKPLYAALGDVDNRHRRPANAVAIARKLMLLDAVLALPDHAWYTTEADKVALFDERGVDRRCVPTRRYDPVTGRRDATPTRRAFVDKLPIGVSGAPPVVTFLFLTTDPQAGAFVRFLHEYAPLFAALPRWRVRVVFPSAIRTYTAHLHAFQAWQTAVPMGLRPQDLSWALHARHRLEAGGTGLTMDELHRLQDVIGDVGGRDFDAHYERWRGEGDHVVPTARLQIMSAGAVETHALAHSYDLFGRLAGLA